MRYFEVKAWLSPTDWQLGKIRALDGSRLDARQFTVGRLLNVSDFPPLVHDVHKPGTEVSFNFGSWMTPVLADRIAKPVQDAFEHDVQLLSIEIEGAQESYSVVNVSSVRRCIDPERSRIERVGGGQTYTSYRIQAALVNGADVFRLEEVRLAVIVSEKAKNLLESLGVTGIRLEDVT